MSGVSSFVTRFLLKVAFQFCPEVSTWDPRYIQQYVLKFTCGWKPLSILCGIQMRTMVWCCTMTTGDYCVMRTMAMTTIVKSADLGAGPNLEPLVCVFLGGVHLSLFVVEKTEKCWVFAVLLCLLRKRYVAIVSIGQQHRKFITILLQVVRRE